MYDDESFEQDDAPHLAWAISKRSSTLHFDAAAMSRVRVRDMLKGYYGTSEKEEKSQDDSIDGASPVSHTPVDLWE